MGKPQPIRSHVGCFSSDRNIRKADGRSTEAQLVRRTAAALVAQMGGASHVTAAQELLIRSASIMQLRLECIAQRYLAAGDAEDVDHLDERFRLMATAQLKTLVALGLERAEQKPLSFQRFLEGRRAG